MAVGFFLLQLSVTPQSEAMRVAARPRHAPVQATVGPPGSVDGQVSAPGGEPLRKAEIFLSRTSPSNRENNVIAASTSENGKFSFVNVAAGTYRVSVRRRGYVQKSGEMRSISVTPGQSVSGVTLTMIPHGVLTGKVLDEEREPVMHATVQLVRERYVRGVRRLVFESGATTNDLGEFRMPGLRPGKYFLYASLVRYGDRVAQGSGTAPPSQMGYTNLYYPGVPDVSQATPVSLRPGQEVGGLDFELRKSRIVQVSGRLNALGANGIQYATVTAVPVDGALVGRSMTSTRDPAGRFELRGMAPGEYILSAVANRGSQGGLTASQRISVGEQGLDNVLLALAPSISLKGSIRVEGEGLFDLSTIQVLAESQTTGVGSTVRNTAGADGTFSLPDLAANSYRVRIAGIPAGAYLKSVMAGSTDVSRQAFVPTESTTLQVVLSATAPRLTGVVKDAQGNTLEGASIAYMALGEGSNAIGVTKADAGGSFALSNLAPGDYKLFAFGNPDADQLENPNYLEQYESRSTSVKLREGSAEVVQLNPIP
jgi:hypothetical protein